MSSVQEMIAIVQIYIHHRKNKEVQIAFPNTPRRMALLLKAYDIAKTWLEENNFKQYHS